MVKQISFVVYIWRPFYLSVARSFYKGSQGIFLCFDITNNETFNHLSDWLTELTQQNLNNQAIILIGTKGDLQDKRQVMREDIDMFIKKK